MAKHVLNVVWDEEKGGYVATCDEYPSMEVVASTYEGALRSIIVAVADMYTPEPPSDVLLKADKTLCAYVSRDDIENSNTEKLFGDIMTVRQDIGHALELLDETKRDILYVLDNNIPPSRKIALLKTIVSERL